MDDLRGKVINELDEYIESALSVDSDYVDCVRTDLLQTVVELLKAQEPIEPIKHLSTGQICGSCKKVLLRKYKYCPACGKAVKWE